MTTALEEGEGSASRPGRSLPPGKTRYPLYRRLSGPHCRSGQLRKISPSWGFDPRTVQPVAQSLYRLRYLAHYETNSGSSQFCERTKKLQCASCLLGKLTRGPFCIFLETFSCLLCNWRAIFSAYLCAGLSDGSWWASCCVNRYVAEIHYRSEKRNLGHRKTVCLT
jgi:hypothetical protein